MSKIPTASRCIQLLLVLIALSQITVHALLMVNHQTNETPHQMKTGTEELSVLLNYKATNSWKTMASSLDGEGFNSLLILGSVQLLPYLLIYIFLFKLFGHYRHGEIFTVATSKCLKNVGKTFLSWIAINLFYPLIVTLFIRFGGWSDSLAIHMNLGTTEFFYLLFGLIIYVIAWVMTQGLTLQKEQELVI